MRHHQKRNLAIESLETRRLLAVTVSNTPSGDLLIAGDTAADTIIVNENDLGTQWEIGGVGTTVTPQGVADVDPVRGGLQILKPTTQNVLIQLDDGHDSLWMLNINQGAGANAVAFVGETTIDMESEVDKVNLGAHPDQIIDFPNLPNTDSNIITSALAGSRANDFIGAVSVDLGSVSDGHELQVRNTDFGRPATQTIAAVAGHLQVIGTAGNDRIAIHSSNNFGGSFDIDTKDGDDIVDVGQLGPVTLDGNLNVNTGEGHDRISLELALAAGNITVRGGFGNDDINLGSPLETPPANRVGSSALGDIVIYGGDTNLPGEDGYDSVVINQATTAGALHVALGTGPRIIFPNRPVNPGNSGNNLYVANSSFSKASSVSGQNREETITFNAVNAPLGLHIQTAGGNDRITILGTLVELGLASIVTGGGDDIVQIGGGSRFETLLMTTGDGNDTVFFGNSAFVLGNASVAELFLDLGAGDDAVDSADSTFGRASVQGGAGSNTRSGQAFSQVNDFDMLFFAGFGESA